MKHEIGRRIRLYREARPSPDGNSEGRRGRLTIQALAERAGLSVDYLNKVELGHHMPTAETLLSVARALDVEVTELLPPTSPETDGKRQALDELRAFASQFSAEEIRYMCRVLAAVMMPR